MHEELRNALKPGTEFDGYRFERVLGAGGFGVTYLATEVLLNRQVAIKEYLPAGMATRDADGLSIAPLSRADADDFSWGMERFRAEAQTLVAFRHPNIVGVHRYFETNDTGYLVMEFVDGQTLNEMVPPGDTLDEIRIHKLFDPLLDGLQAVHDRLFLHRDIKPANIFIRDDDTPILIDFGAARQALGQHSKSLTAIISEGYAPYEQYESAGEQGPWTDIYAVGGVLYRCVTGRRPTDAPARVSAIMRGRADPLTPASAAAAGRYSDALLLAIDRALAVREDERPQSIAELRALKSPPNPAAAPVEDAKKAVDVEVGAAATAPADDATLYAGTRDVPPDVSPLPPPPSGNPSNLPVMTLAVVVVGAALFALALIGVVMALV